MSRRRSYALAGAILAFGAPLGLLLLRLLRGGRLSVPWILGEICGQAEVYLYVLVSTVVVFSMFGLALGRTADRLAEQSTTDPLTGLGNRRRFQERLADEFERARRYDSFLSLVLLDVDHLKEVNDGQGHPAGDVAIRTAAEAIREAARSTDVVARWGGDEFVVLAPNTDSAQAESLASRICALARDPPGARGHATLSAGVATVAPAHDRSSAASLLQSADQALYTAKRDGRGRAAVWTP